MGEEVHGMAGAENCRHVGEDQRCALRIDGRCGDGNAGALVGDGCLAATIDPGFMVAMPDGAATGQGAVEVDSATRVVASQGAAETQRRLQDDQRIDRAARADANGCRQGSLGVMVLLEVREGAFFRAKQGRAKSTELAAGQLRLGAFSDVENAWPFLEALEV